MDVQYPKTVAPARRAIIEQSTAIALVGSRLDNGDVIISTPQDACMLVAREGVALPPDFLSLAE